jgi:hypothetical protein
VRLEFDEPLDRALAESLVRVVAVDDDGSDDLRGIAGRVRVGDGETVWTFEADGGFEPGRYAVLAEPGLTDRAGNSLSRPFDAAVGGPDTAREPVRLPFEVRDRQ